MLLWLVRVKPMNNKTIMFLEVFNEVIFLCISLALGSLYFRETMVPYSKEIGWLCIGLVCLCIMLNIGLIMPC